METFDVDFADVHGLWSTLTLIKQLEEAVEDTVMAERLKRPDFWVKRDVFGSQRTFLTSTRTLSRSLTRFGTSQYTFGRSTETFFEEAVQ
jgi:hypothetical protein